MSTCICCCSTSPPILGSEHGFPSTSCVVCGYTRYQVDDAVPDADAFLNDSDYLDDLSQARSHRSLMQWHHYKAVQRIMLDADSNPSRTRVLDAGCFNGFFVKELFDHGVDAIGMDFNSVAVKHGMETYGLESRLSVGSLSDLHASDSYNAITLFEVIEHLKDPRGILETARSLLQPGGLLILSCPNADALWRPPADFPPHHLSRFTKSSLVSLVQGLGLDVVVCEEQRSSFLLIKHWMGAQVRSQKGAKDSMRGGGIPSGGLAARTREFANRHSKLFSAAFAPGDALMKLTDQAYLGLFLVARAH